MSRLWFGKTIFTPLAANHGPESALGHENAFGSRSVPDSSSLSFLVTGALVALVVIADVILACLFLLLGPEILLGAGAPAYRPLVMGLGRRGRRGLIGDGAPPSAAMFLHFALRIPIEITIDDDHEVHFKAWLRTVTIPVRDLMMIRTGTMVRPQSFPVGCRAQARKADFDQQVFPTSRTF